MEIIVFVFLLTQVDETLTSETTEYCFDRIPLVWKGPVECKDSCSIQKTSLLLVDILEKLWHNFYFLQSSVLWDCVFLIDVPSSYRNLRKRTSSIHISMDWMHYIFLWDAEKSCSIVWIWKGSIHNYSLLVFVPRVISMSFQLVISQEMLLCMGFLSRATIEHHPVFHQKTKTLISEKKRGKTSQNAKFIFNKNWF